VAVSSCRSDCVSRKARMACIRVGGRPRRLPTSRSRVCRVAPSRGRCRTGRIASVTSVPSRESHRVSRALPVGSRQSDRVGRIVSVGSCQSDRVGRIAPVGSPRSDRGGRIVSVGASVGRRGWLASAPAAGLRAFRRAPIASVAPRQSRGARRTAVVLHRPHRPSHTLGARRVSRTAPVSDHMSRTAALAPPHSHHVSRSGPGSPARR
jgi:hypothetical protein